MLFSIERTSDGKRRHEKPCDGAFLASVDRYGTHYWHIYFHTARSLIDMCEMVKESVIVSKVDDDPDVDGKIEIYDNYRE